MAIRRKTTRDDRRRRVLVDDTAAALPTQHSASSMADSESSLSLYAPDALAANQPRITDLIPVRAIAQAFCSLVGFSVIGLHWTLGVILHSEDANSSAFAKVFDGLQPGSLGAWTACATFIIAAVISVLLFWIRQHRIDDYGGRYRIWIYAAVCFLLLSIEAAVGLRAAVHYQLQGVLPSVITPIHLSAAWGIIAIVAIARLAVEMRASIGSIIWLVVCCSLYAAAAIVRLDIIDTSFAGPISAFSAAVTLAAHWSLAMSLFAYARFVYLDAQGVVAEWRIEAAKRREQTAKRKAKTLRRKRETSDVDDTAASSEPATQATTRAKRSSTGSEQATSDENAEVETSRSRQQPVDESKQPRQTQFSATSDESFSDEDDESENSLSRMSKSARKKARKAKRRQQRAA
ncbi:MAG: hypothetical protein KDB27_32655 [Planctomycetales bacterium]|nr:hypothetical protein [Planctomycetales bacterium]